MRISLLVLMLMVTVVRPVLAGAWLRDKGTGFLSLTTTLRSLNDTWQVETGIFGEFGVAPRLTLGLDLNEVTNTAGHALIFARLPIGPVDRGTKVALQLGLGGYHTRGQWAKMARATLSLGRGFSSSRGAGWFNVDAGVDLLGAARNPAYKLDATLGWSSGGRIRPLLQFESTYIGGSPLFWSVIPGALIEGRKGTTWQIAIERKAARQTSLGLKFGLWRSF